MVSATAVAFVGMSVGLLQATAVVLTVNLRRRTYMLEVLTLPWFLVEVAEQLQRIKKRRVYGQSSLFCL